MPPGSTGHTPMRARPHPSPVPGRRLATLPKGRGQPWLPTRRNDRLHDSRRLAGAPQPRRQDDQLGVTPDLGRGTGGPRRAADVHGCPAFGPDEPASGKGFISQGQTRALNITIRRAAQPALAHMDTARNVATQPHGRNLHVRQQEALDFCQFQLSTVRDYTELPGSLHAAASLLSSLTPPILAPEGAA